MKLQITDAGVALLEAATGPIVLTSAVLGSGFNYVPSPTDTNIHGTTVFTTVPSAPMAQNANIVKYTFLLDYELGDFQFGEVGYFTQDGTLFALGASNVLISKEAENGVDKGNSIRVDAYLSMVGQNYDMWLDYAESNNQFRMAVLDSVDRLPPSQAAVPNAYIIKGLNSGQSAFVAYTDRQALWNFDVYQYANTMKATITGFDSQSVTIDASAFLPDMVPAYIGQLVIQFTTGALYSICRNVASVITTGSSVRINFTSPVAVLPVVGDTITFYSRQALSVDSIILPIASATLLGGIKVGTTLTIDPATGVLNVAATSYPVTSVNGKTGDVVLVATDINGISDVGKSGLYSDLIGAPAPYQLPIATATTLGGVKVPAGAFITVGSDGSLATAYQAVKSVNSIAPDATGNVTVPPAAVIGLVGPQQIPNAADLDTYQTTGLFYVDDADAPSILNAPGTASGRPGAIVEIEPFSTTASGSDVMQRWQSSSTQFFRRYTQSSNTWSTWVQSSTVATPPIATTTSLGNIIVGQGLNITPGGTLSTAITSVNGQGSGDIVITLSSLGGVPEVPAAPVNLLYARQAGGTWVNLATVTFDAGTF